MNDLPLFDYAESIRHRDAGMNLAAENNATRLTEAREIAVAIAKRDGDVDADRVTLELVRRGYPVSILGNSAGSLFRDRRFECTNEFTYSTRIQSHKNRIFKWKLAK